MKSKDFLNEKWSKKYKRSINCSHPKGFSQRAHCAGRKKNESTELTMVCPDCGYSQETLAEMDRRGFLKGLGAAALAGAGGAAMAGDLEGQIGPLPIMATIKVQMPDGTVKTKKIDLGHEYDYRMDDAKKEIEQILNRKGVKNYTIHLDRYRDNEAYLDREQIKPQSKTNNNYMDRKPYEPKGDGNYMDNTPARASGKHNYMDPANYESVQEGGPFSYGAKKPRKGSVADLAAKKRKEQEKDRQPAEPKDHMVGVAKVIKDVAEGLETNKYQVVVKGQKRSYSVWVEAKNEEVAIIRAQQYVAREHNDHGTRAGVIDMKKGVAEGEYKCTCHPGDPDPDCPVHGLEPMEVGDALDIKEADAELAEPPERPRKQQTATKSKSKLDPNMFASKQDQPLAKTDPLDDLKKKAGVGSDKPKITIKKASQADTLSKTAGIGSDDMADMLSRMRNIEIDRDLEAYPEPEPPETLPSVEVNTANLPAVAGQALQAAGVQNPDFHQVANLPGNMSDQIRQLGKSLFGSLTMTPTKRIHVVANLGGQGPNSTAEVNAVAGFLKEHGKDLGPGDIDFERVMPGYKAQTHMFSAAGIRWMLVKDFAGQYIYCWPEEDSHDAVDVIGQDTDVKKLR